MQKYFIICSMAIFSLFIAGCSSVPVTNKIGNGQVSNNKMADFNSSTERFLNNSVTSTVSDLLVGKKVMVMGTTNADGTINASQIIMGEFPTSSFGFDRGGSTSSTVQFRNQSGGSQNMNGGNFNGQRPNITGANGSGKVRAKTASMTRVNGEILKIDTTSLVVKVAEGGSKMVFYTNNTKIRTLIIPIAVSTSTPIN